MAKEGRILHILTEFDLLGALHLFFIFCLLAHESGDLSQAETKLTLAKKAEQQNDTFFPSK